MSETRTALLDAAADAVLHGDWAKARMADVARAAGVSRQTLYYEFGTKDALAEALALLEAERYMTGAEAAMTGHDGSPAEAIAAATEFTLREAGGNPLLKAVLTDSHMEGAGAMLPYLTTRAEGILAAVRARIAAYCADHWPHLPTADVELAADTVVRLTVSHLVLPGARPEQTAASIARLVDRLLPEGPAA